MNMSTKQFLHLKPKIQVEERVKRLYEPEKRKVCCETFLGLTKATHLKVYDYQNMSLMRIPIEMQREGEVGRELVG